MNNYGSPAINLAKGAGAEVWDDQGSRYLDALGGIAVCFLGHSHPAVTQAITEQAARLTHCSNLYGIAPQKALAEKLCTLSGMDKAFFANSGAEANEAAIKLARLHGHAKGYACPQILVMEQAFHGRTLAALTATGNVNAQQGFTPLVDGFERVAYNDIEAVKAKLAQMPEASAIMLEPIQGEGGLAVPDDGYLTTLRAICDEQDLLLIFDEVQTGMGRTGEWFAWQHEQAQPDVMTLAKALGNGVPIGACIAKGAAADLFQPGSHGSTYGGNPLATAAANAVIETIVSNDYLALATELGDKIKAGLAAELGDIPGVVEIRGKGLMIGIELDRPCTELVGKAMQRGLLINVAAQKVVRLLPAVVMSNQQTEQLIGELAGHIREFLADTAAVA